MKYAGIKYTGVMLAILATSVGIAGCADKKTSSVDLPPGQYEKSSSSTNSAGTTTEKTDSATVGYDSYGNKKAVVKSKKTTDPKGLFNKNSTESQEVIEKPAQ